MSETMETRSGTRCHICTGCGRCFAEDADQKKVHIVMAAPQQSEPFVYTEQTAHLRLAVADIGTTTLAMQLYGTDGSIAEEYSCVNPQVKYGADVLSRIQAATQAETQAVTQAAEDMRSLVTAKLAEGITLFQNRLQAGETMILILAGNTTMIYLLLGYDPAELGQAPFTASHLQGTETEIAGVRTLIFPGLSAFVGGDIVAGMYACGLRESGAITLLIDLGTNGEMVLGNADRQIACATAAGPAFEGGVNRGVWGADMVHLIAELRRRGLVDETGLLEEPYFEQGVRIGDVLVTQEAVRAIQLAKGAIGAGIRILMQHYGLCLADGSPDYDKVDRVILAGGFGYYLRPEDAAYIGLLPAELAKKAVSGGNTALAGALRIGRKLFTGEISDWKTEVHAGQAEVLNLAKQPEFETLYLEHMGL